MSLQSVRLNRAVSDLNKLERAVDSVERHVRLCQACTRQIDARHLLGLADALRGECASFHRHLARLTAEGASAAKVAPRRPPASAGVGRFAPYVGGQVAEFKAISGRLRDKLDRLHGAVDSLQRLANSHINDPGRWGDAAAHNPVNELFGQLQNLIGLLASVRSRA